MATSTLLQYLEGTDGEGNAFKTLNISNRRQIETFIAAGNISQYDAVSFDFSQSTDGAMVLHVVQGSNGATNGCCIGIAQSQAKAGQNVDVVIAGITDANVEGATVQGDRLYLNANGQLAVYAAAIEMPIVAIATEADTANIAPVVFLKQF